MPRVVHFEIPFDEVERAKAFYGDLFGWKIAPAEGSPGYWLITTTDEEGERDVEGGMMARQEPGQPIINYIDVADLDESVRRVADLGGTIVMGKTAVPKTGYFAICRDTEGNVFGLWKTDPEASVFSDAAEAFVAVMAAIIAADEDYSVDEIRTVWHEVETLELFAGKDYRELESKVFKAFGKDPATPTAFAAGEIGTIIGSARQMLDESLRELAYKMAVKLAHADRTLKGYVREIDEREQAVLDRLREGLGITDTVAARIDEEVAESRYQF